MGTGWWGEVLVKNEGIVEVGSWMGKVWGQTSRPVVIHGSGGRIW